MSLMITSSQIDVTFRNNYNLSFVNTHPGGNSLRSCL